MEVNFLKEKNSHIQGDVWVDNGQCNFNRQIAINFLGKKLMHVQGNVWVENGQCFDSYLTTKWQFIKKMQLI